MRTVALATHGGCPKLSADDQLLIPHLRDFDIEAKAVVWDNQETDWSEFDQVIIRSCWDYHLRLPEFLAWIAVVESHDVDLQNSGPLVRWNADKRTFDGFSSAALRFRKPIGCLNMRKPA